MILSIITPVWNQEKLILRALDSVPERSDIEIIVIDDNSDDKTYGVVDTYKHCNSNTIHLLHNEERCRPCGCINRGLDIAKGKYVVQLDSDDYFDVNIKEFIDRLYTHDEDIIFFNNQINNGDVWRPQMMSGLCDHICMYKRAFIGELRHKYAKWGTGWSFHQTLLERDHTEFYTDIVLYHYNYPRSNSNYDLGVKGLL